jgi:hypothetical protein
MGLIVLLLAVTMPISNVGKGKRIEKIEKDFNLTYADAIKVTIGGKERTYWRFMLLDYSNAFLGCPITVPTNATDTQVINATISSMVTAHFYDDLLKSTQAPTPTPTPAPKPTPANSI